MRASLLTIALLFLVFNCFPQVTLNNISKEEHLYGLHNLGSDGYLMFTLLNEDNKSMVYKLNESFEVKWEYELPLENENTDKTLNLMTDFDISRKKYYETFLTNDKILISNYYHVKGDDHIEFFVFNENGFEAHKGIEFDEFREDGLELIQDGNTLYHITQRKKTKLLGTDEVYAMIKKIDLTDISLEKEWEIQLPDLDDIAWHPVKVENGLFYFAGRNDDTDDDGVRSPLLDLRAFDENGRQQSRETIRMRFDERSRKFMPRIYLEQQMGNTRYREGFYYEVSIYGNKYLMVHGYTGEGKDDEPNAIYMMSLGTIKEDITKMKELVHEDMEVFESNKRERDNYQLRYYPAQNITVWAYSPQNPLTFFSQRDMYYKGVIYKGDQKLGEVTVPKKYMQFGKVDDRNYLVNRGFPVFEFQFAVERTNFDVGYILREIEIEGDVGYFDELHTHLNSIASMDNCFTYLEKDRALVFKQNKDGSVSISEVVNQ